jgi:hypothetical protein
MARHALRQFVASAVNSLEIAGLVFAPVLIGLLAFLAMPVMMASAHGTGVALGAVAGQALLVAAPVFLLRKRLHPADAVEWERMLPVPRALGWQADLLVAARVIGWVAAACGVSAAIWIYQWPAWLRPIPARALCALAASLALGWLLAGTAVAARRLGLRNRAIPRTAAISRTGTAPALAYRARALRPRHAALWHRLFWLPFWRADSQVGRQQCLLLLASLAAAAAWMTHALPLPRAALGLLTSLALVLLVDRGDKAVREQAEALAPMLAMWPLPPGPLLLAARAFTLLPAALVLCALAGLLGGSGAAGFRPGLAAAWFATAALALSATVALPAPPRGRVVLVLLSILLLTAIGSELWP